MSKSKKATNDPRKKSGPSAARSRPTSGGLAKPRPDLSDILESKAAAIDELVRSRPFNELKPAEFNSAAHHAPPEGPAFEPSDPAATGSTITEANKTNASLDRVRTDAGGHVLTTNQGVPVGDNQSSLKAGLRGPTLLEDFILREKITHFDHERIPERIVHARGSAAHGFFESYKSMKRFTRASVFEPGKQTSYRTMQGFGVHAYRLVNDAGESVFVKFHWLPKQGTHSLVWDEAVKISGADPDFHRRDLWEAIEAGAYPEWELNFQIITEAQAEKFSFDILDATKIVPEELVPLMPVGRLVLNRNPDNFFAETEQVAFCTAHVVPGIDFSNDPLLAGRIHSYVDTQISRLGGPNFHEIPINAPITPVHNNQRDGLHRQALNRGRVSYEPNSLGGGCPFQAGAAGFVSFPAKAERTDHKVRGKAERFADHYTQATLFWKSQTAVEQQHIINAFRFELSKVQMPAIRERMVSGLMNVALELAQAVADGLGITKMPAPMPKVLQKKVKPEVAESKALSLFARPGTVGIQTRRVAILVADGVNGAEARLIAERLTLDGAVAVFVAPKLGGVKTDGGKLLEADASFEIAPSVVFDAMVIADGEAAVTALTKNARALDFLKEQYRHCKPILVLGAGTRLLAEAGIHRALPSGKPDSGLIVGASGKAVSVTDAFIAAIATHRHYDREADPPPV